MAQNNSSKSVEQLGSVENMAAEDMSGIEELTGDELQTKQDQFWIDLSANAFRQSTSWLDMSLRRQWEKNLAHFNSRFAPGSKYNSPAYQKRSRIFRPKTRASVRQNEAAIAAAMFSTNDLVSVTPQNDERQESKASAAIGHALLEYRLQHTIPWFLTTVGAFQDTQNYGICGSYQYWDYLEREVESIVYDSSGQPIVGDDGEYVTHKKTKLVRDCPNIDLLMPENMRFHPAADWREPVNSSPYFIRMAPLFACDVLERMQQSRPGQQAWKSYSLATLLSHKVSDHDSTRSAREAGRSDSADVDQGIYSLIDCHENFVRVNGEEYVFWTLGSDRLLSDPAPLDEVYFHGKRPIVIGISNIEAHKAIPAAHTQMIEGLQEGTNDVQNQRSDNVALVLNKRYLLKRGQNIDTSALMRNVPGGAVVTQDPEKDVRVLETSDVTSSSYNEQDRFDVQIDEMMGSLSQSSVSSNRNLNETVGGMNIMNSSASAVSEYTIRCFVETWVEPVLRQLLLLEQHYENDAVVLALASETAKLEKFGVSEVTDELLMKELSLTVNVGMGATNPQQKVERLAYGISTVAGLPGAMEKVNVEEVITEVFGALGYKNGKRFFTPPEGQEQQQPPPSPEMLQYQLKEQEIKQKFDLENRRLEQERELRMADIAARENISLSQLYARLDFEREREDRREALEFQKDKTKRDTVALAERNRTNEMMLKQEMGSGI